MNGAFYIGAIGLEAQQRALEVVANNIANINTTAFKRSAVQFSELSAPARDVGGAFVQTGPASLEGVTFDASPLVLSQGPLQQTRGPMDLAINGNGFMELAGPSGRTLLWRGGTLRVNTDGYLATTDGIPLRAMISVPRDAASITIAGDGAVSTLPSDGSSPQQIGQIDLVTVPSPETLVDTGKGYFEAGEESRLMTVRPGEEGSGTLAQGALESSNVQLADEMTGLLLAQRAFGANAQVIQVGDQLMSIVNQLRR